MRLRTTSTITLLVLATLTSKAQHHTLAEAENIIIILLIIVILLLIIGAIILHYNRIIRQRNKKLRRILNGLEAYRKMIEDKALPLPEQENVVVKPKKSPKEKLAKGTNMDDGQKFFVNMDALMTKEKPFTNPDFDHNELIKLMGVTQDTFIKLLPRYSDPEDMISYINSRRTEYGAQLIIEHPEYKMDDISIKCGFRNTSTFNSAFKFAFGITPTDYYNSMNHLFKQHQ